MILSILLNGPPPYDPLRDPVWQFIGVVAAILIGIVAILLAISSVRQQQRRKEITYQVILNAPIISVNKAIENRVEIHLDGFPVKDAKLLSLKVWNSGNLSIRSEDYFEPITFEFEGGTIISSDILKTEPQNLIEPKDIKSFLKQEKESIKLNNFPLNPNDSINFIVLLTGQYKISKRGRIAEGTIIELDPSKPLNKFMSTIKWMISLVILSIFTLSINFITDFIHRSALITYVLITINFIIILITLFLMMRAATFLFNTLKAIKNR